ncbi:hypothetical protein C6P40_002988, partial [Pichia californica]
MSESQVLSSLNQSPLNFNAFPLEVLIIVLSYVDPLTLKYLPFVCKTWYNILNDDTIWHKIFKLHYPYKDEIFPSITRSNLFKNELLFRNQLKLNYRRGKLLNQQYQINQIITSNSISIDWKRNKLTIIDIPREIFLTCDLRNGKSIKYVTDFVPEGVTSYDTGTSSNSIHGSRLLIFGRWDGSILGSLIDWKGLILSDPHNWGIMPGGRITCVTACINSSIYTPTNCLPPLLASSSSSSSSLFSNSKKNSKISHNLLAKNGHIGAFSADESNNIYGWDIRSGECLFKYKLINNDYNSKILKLQSDGKSILILLLENGELIVLKNIFKNLKDLNLTEIEVFKIGNVPVDRNGLNTVNFFVDYGNQSVIVWNHIELSIFSYANINNINYNNHDNRLSYKVKDNQFICSVSFENNDKLFIKRDTNIVGTDPLLAAICSNTGIIEIINIRESLSTSELKPIQSIIPKFITEHDEGNLENDFQINYLDQSISKIASICLNSLVIAISNHFGKVEIYDIITGEFLRITIDRIGKKKIQEIENILPNRILNSPIKLYLDESNTRGLLILGNHMQYFKCGGSKNDDFDESKKHKNKKIGNDKKGNLNQDLKYTLDIYEEEKQQKKKEQDLFIKYNGGDNSTANLLDEEEQLNMALVMSMSLNENNNTNNNINNINNNNNNNTNIPDEDSELEK